MQRPSPLLPDERVGFYDAYKRQAESEPLHSRRKAAHKPRRHSGPCLASKIIDGSRACVVLRPLPAQRRSLIGHGPHGSMRKLRVCDDPTEAQKPLVLLPSPAISETSICACPNDAATGLQRCDLPAGK